MEQVEDTAEPGMKRAVVMGGSSGIYLEALEQLSVMRKLNIRVTDIRPGFVDTALLGDGLHYPYRLDVKYAARKIVKAIEQHRYVAVIDGWYRLLTMFWRIVPRCLWRHLPIYCRKEVG